MEAMDFRGYITVLKKNGTEGSKVLLEDAKLTFGCAKDSHILIQRPNVALNHCYVVGSGEQVFLINKQLKYPTKLNGKDMSVGRAKLSNGDIINVVGRDFRWEQGPKNSSVMAASQPRNSSKLSPSKPLSKPNSPLVEGKKGASPSPKKMSPRRSSPQVQAKESPSKKRKRDSLVGKGSASPKAKRRRGISVTFGPRLTPEKFDHTLPASTPLRRGARPFNRRVMTPDYFGNPIIYNTQTSRMSAPAIEFRGRSSKESPKKASPLSPKNKRSSVGLNTNTSPKKSVTSSPSKKSPKVVVTKSVADKVQEGGTKTISPKNFYSKRARLTQTPKLGLETSQSSSYEKNSVFSNTVTSKAPKKSPKSGTPKSGAVKKNIHSSGKTLKTPNTSRKYRKRSRLFTESAEILEISPAMSVKFTPHIMNSRKSGSLLGKIKKKTVTKSVPKKRRLSEDMTPAVERKKRKLNTPIKSTSSKTSSKKPKSSQKLKVVVKRLAHSEELGPSSPNLDVNLSKKKPKSVKKTPESGSKLKSPVKTPKDGEISVPSGSAEKLKQTPESAGKSKKVINTPESAGKSKKAVKTPESAGKSKKAVKTPESAGKSKKAVKTPESAGKSKKAVKTPESAGKSKKAVKTPESAGKSKKAVKTPESAGKSKKAVKTPKSGGKLKILMKPPRNGEKSEPSDSESELKKIPQSKGKSKGTPNSKKSKPSNEKVETPKQESMSAEVPIIKITQENLRKVEKTPSMPRKSRNVSGKNLLLSAVKKSTPAKQKRKSSIFVAVKSGMKLKKTPAKKPLFSEVVKRGLPRKSIGTVKSTRKRTKSPQKKKSQKKLPKTKLVVPKLFNFQSTGRVPKKKRPKLFHLPPDFTESPPPQESLALQPNASSPYAGKSSENTPSISSVSHGSNQVSYCTTPCVSPKYFLLSPTSSVNDVAGPSHSGSLDVTTYDFNAVSTPSVSVENFVSPLKKSQPGSPILNDMKHLFGQQYQPSYVNITGIRGMFRVPSSSPLDIHDLLRISPNKSRHTSTQTSPQPSLQQSPPKSPVNFQSMRQNVQKKIATSSQKSSSPAGVKRLFQEVASPDYAANVSGVKHLMVTPAHPVVHYEGVAEMFATPLGNQKKAAKISTEPSYTGVKRLFSQTASPDYTNVTGVKKLMVTEHNQTVNYSGIAEMLETPEVSTAITVAKGKTAVRKNSARSSPRLSAAVAMDKEQKTSKIESSELPPDAAGGTPRERKESETLIPSSKKNTRGQKTSLTPAVTARKTRRRVSVTSKKGAIHKQPKVTKVAVKVAHKRGKENPEMLVSPGSSSSTSSSGTQVRELRNRKVVSERSVKVAGTRKTEKAKPVAKIAPRIRISPSVSGTSNERKETGTLISKHKSNQVEKKASPTPATTSEPKPRSTRRVSVTAKKSTIHEKQKKEANPSILQPRSTRGRAILSSGQTKDAEHTKKDESQQKKATSQVARASPRKTRSRTEKSNASSKGTAKRKVTKERSPQLSSDETESNAEESEVAKVSPRKTRSKAVMKKATSKVRSPVKKVATSKVRSHVKKAAKKGGASSLLSDELEDSSEKHEAGKVSPRKRRSKAVMKEATSKVRVPVKKVAKKQGVLQLSSDELENNPKKRLLSAVESTTRVLRTRRKFTF